MSQYNTIWATYVSLGVQALIPIAIGSFKSLKVRHFWSFQVNDLADSFRL